MFYFIRVGQSFLDASPSHKAIFDTFTDYLTYPNLDTVAEAYHDELRAKGAPIQYTGMTYNAVGVPLQSVTNQTYHMQAREKDRTTWQDFVLICLQYQMAGLDLATTPFPDKIKCYENVRLEFTCQQVMDLYQQGQVFGHQLWEALQVCKQAHADGNLTHDMDVKAYFDTALQTIINA